MRERRPTRQEEAKAKYRRSHFFSTTGSNEKISLKDFEATGKFAIMGGKTLKLRTEHSLIIPQRGGSRQLKNHPDPDTSERSRGRR